MVHCLLYEIVGSIILTIIRQIQFAETSDAVYTGL